ncbi:hypothetical protein FNAPI_2 [Fusarium napiforme]|uniref:Uncharacterized protein n=1 Tax=Fusarium napiforme TaxID=42672 RepID=A0A8H5K6N2_9HYPO|nr:hypothetical protein FNAPI_2 [Fusarium napiforme]
MLLTILFVNGYHALAYPEQSRRQEEGIVLRSSDITTILSIATKVLDYLRLLWTGMIGWRLSFIVMETQGLEIKQLSSYLNLRPSFRSWPRRKEWLVAVIFLLLMPQPFISPVILGSVDWSPATKEGKPMTLASGEPTARARGWYWYLDQSPNRRVTIRTAGGMASRAWGAEDLQHQGTSRHVMPTTASVNSTLLDAILPSIQIHNITWEIGDIPDETARYARQNASQLSLVDESPFDYIRTGVGLIFNPGETWNTKEVVNIDHSKWEAAFPQATKWTGSMSVFMTLSRQQAIGCQTIKPNAFGNSSTFDHLRAFPGNNNEVNETCIAWGTVNFTAGTIIAPRSKFVTPQIVEYNPWNDTVLDTDVVGAIEPSIWTREALWLLPDTMAQVAVMNTSQLPTWENLNNYTETLIRISYLANWDTLHALYDDQDTTEVTLLPAQRRLRASVDLIRLLACFFIDRMRDQFLEQRTIELFRAILTLLHQVMQFFLDGKPKKFIGSLMQQGSYKEPLFQSVEAIKACAQAVNEEASQCQARMVMKVYEKTEQTQIVFHRLMEFLLTNPRFQAADSGNSAPDSDPSRLKVSSYDLLNADRLSWQDQDISRSTTPTILQSPSQQSTLSKAGMEHEKQRLLGCLNYNPEALTRGIASILSFNYQLSENERARVAAMLRHDRFQTFMKETQTSTRLLVNGRGDLSAKESVSPFSVVMAELARMSNMGLTESVPVFILKYFCSEHQPSLPNDPLASAVGMMASILGQLICQMMDKGLAVDLSFISDSKWRKLERLELHTLCTVFKRVVDQIPRGGVVLCSIDEVSVYETSRLGEETEMAVKKLVQLADQGRYPVFKLLVTCYDHALDVGRYFSGYTLDLKEDIEADDTADWIIASQLS